MPHIRRDFPDSSSKVPRTVTLSIIDRKRGQSSRFGGLGWAMWRIRAHVRMHSGARNRSFGRGRAPVPAGNPAAMTLGVMSARAPVGGRRSGAGFRRVMSVRSRPRQAGTQRTDRAGSPGRRSRPALIDFIAQARSVVIDQCSTSSGSARVLRKLPMLYARTCS